MRTSHNIVLAFGAFDILHPGHLAYLKYAKRHGKKLFVIIARDSSIKRTKGVLPVFSEKDRQKIIAALEIVDKAILGDTKDHYTSIQRVQPSTVCLGYDHRIKKNEIREALKKRNITIPNIVRAKKYKPLLYKSSLFKEKIKR